MTQPNEYHDISCDCDDCLTFWAQEKEEQAGEINKEIDEMELNHKD